MTTNDSNTSPIHTQSHKRAGPKWPDAFPEDDIQESVEIHREPPYYGTATGELICDPAVSDGAVRLYLYLSWRAGLKNNNIRSRSTMASDLGVSSHTVRNRIKQLVAAGWVAVVTRLTTSGDQTSNHYHVFESRETSATWRKDFKPSSGETLQLIPPTPNERKPRSGIGGRPKNAKSDGKTSQDGGNSSLPVDGGVINSSYVPPETQVTSNHLLSNQEIVDANASSGDATHPAPVETPPTNVPEKPDSSKSKRKRAPKPQAKPRKFCPPEPVYEAVELHVAGIKSDPNVPYAWKAPIGYIAKWLKGEIAKWKDIELGKISHPAEARHVEMFAKWYRNKHQNAALPTDVEKFIRHWRAWASSLKSEASPAAREFPHQLGQATDEEYEQTRAMIMARKAAVS